MANFNVSTKTLRTSLCLILMCSYSIKIFLNGFDVSTITFPSKSASHKMKSSMDQRDKKISLAAPSNSAISLIGHRCDSCAISFRFDSQLGQHLKSKTHLNKCAVHVIFEMF